MKGHYSTKRILAESLPLLLGIALISVLSGQILQGNQALLVSLPVFLLVVPAFANQSGDIAAVLASRLTTELYTGATETSILKSQNLWGSVIGLLTSSSIGFTFLSAIAYGSAVLLGFNTLPFATLCAIILLAGLSTVVMVMVVGVVAALVTFKGGLDPDNFSSPIVTTVSDLIGILLLLTFAGLIGGV